MGGYINTSLCTMKLRKTYLWPAEGHRVGGSGSRGAELVSLRLPVTATPTVLLLFLFLLLNSCGGARERGREGVICSIYNPVYPMQAYWPAYLGWCWGQRGRSGELSL